MSFSCAAAAALSVALPALGCAASVPAAASGGGDEGVALASVASEFAFFEWARWSGYSLGVPGAAVSAGLNVDAPSAGAEALADSGPFTTLWRICSAITVSGTVHDGKAVLEGVLERAGESEEDKEEPACGMIIPPRVSLVERRRHATVTGRPR